MEIAKVKSFMALRKSQLIYSVLGFILGIAPLDGKILPFGCAFLCAVPQKFRKGVFVGVLLASFFDICVPLALFCAIYLYAVMTAKDNNGGVFVATRILLSFSISALRVAYVAISGVNGMDDIFLLLASAISYPAFTFAFIGYFDKKKELRKKRYEISLLSFAFAFTVLLSPFEINSLSFSFIPATFFTLCASRKYGFAYGGVYGIVCGLVSGGAGCGALGVLGMSYGLLVNEIEPIGLVLSFMLAVSGYFYLAGIEGVGTCIVMLLAVYAVFFPLRKRITVCSSAERVEKRLLDRRISRYATAFSSLSSLFYTVSDTTRSVGITELNEKIVNTVDSHCSRCSGCELDKSEISNFFTSEIRRNGVAAYSRIPTHITSRCCNAYSMARDINNLPTLRAKEGEQGLKQMADEYSAFSSILIDASKKQESKLSCDKALAKELKNRLSSIGINCDGVRILGERQREITVYGVNPEKMDISPNEIIRTVSETVGTAVSQPDIVLHDGYYLMKMNSVPELLIECAKISEAKNGEIVCGDTVSVFENDENYYYCLVSDGMGSGRDAALTSRLSAIMLEKLLSVGAEKESALKLLNKALVEKDEEVFATVDLLEIDRILSRATLIKAGAAPTILIRNNRAALIESRTPPAGIMKNVIADKKSFPLKKGDMIVMLSDGILQTGSENNLIPNENLPPMPSARALASKIFREARKNCEVSDDMSVCVLRIH